MRPLGLLFFSTGLASLLFVLGCANVPKPKTQVFEEKQNFVEGPGHLQIDEKTILIDARAPFEHALSHPSGSINLQWTDFVEKKAPFEGVLENDLFFHSRRLARMGIGPDSALLIFGSGKSGHGEEGRLAWTLKRLGISKIKFAGLESFRMTMTSTLAPPREGTPLWKPSGDETLEIRRAEALGFLKEKKSAVETVVVLDVRDVSLRSKDLSAPTRWKQLKIKPRVLEVPWSQFAADEKAAKAAIATLGLQDPRQTILVLDQNGVGSAYVTMILREWGYVNARNWSGGYREIDWFLSSTKRQ